MSGSYIVTATAQGAIAAVPVRLTNHSVVRVTGVTVKWGMRGERMRWSFLAAGGPLLPPGPNTDLPWSGTAMGRRSRVAA